MKIARRVLRAVMWFVLGVLLVRLGLPAPVTIQWDTASEVEAAGFRLYRAASAEGPFTLLSETLIPAQGDPLTGASYAYEDRETVWGGNTSISWKKWTSTALPTSTQRWCSRGPGRGGPGLSRRECCWRCWENG